MYNNELSEMQRAEGGSSNSTSFEARTHLGLKLWVIFCIDYRYTMAAVMGSRMASALASGSRIYTGIRAIHSTARVASHENPLVGGIQAMQTGN